MKVNVEFLVWPRRVGGAGVGEVIKNGHNY